MVGKLDAWVGGKVSGAKRIGERGSERSVFTSWLIGSSDWCDYDLFIIFF